MGIVRLLLALCVVASHTHSTFGLPLLPGDKAVQLFYVVSGYYITMVLCEKYNAPGLIVDFYVNRFSRLYPSYAFVLAATLILGFLWDGVIWWAPPGGLFDVAGDLDAVGASYFTALNLAMVGIDTSLFTYIDPITGGLGLTLDFRTHDLPGWRLLLVPQAWSLGVELAFYAVAPFLVTKRLPWLVGTLFASVGLRVAGSFAGFDHDPFTYRFSPFELSTFLLGALAYRIGWQPRLGHALVMSVACVAMILAYREARTWLPLPAAHRWVETLALTCFVAACLPALHRLTGRSRWDRLVGQLSYPVYLNHMLVIGVVLALGLEPWVAPITAVAATVLAAAMVFAIDGRVDRWRQKRVGASQWRRGVEPPEPAAASELADPVPARAGPR